MNDNIKVINLNVNKNIIQENNNNSLNEIVFNNNNQVNENFFKNNTNQNIVIEENVALENKELIYKDDSIYIQELENQNILFF